MKTVRELRKEIDKVMIKGYNYQTNLSWSEMLVGINYRLGIGARLIQVEDKMDYEFIVDTQFLSNNEISYDEICMCKDIIDILEKNRKFVLKRLKKYTVEEYVQKQVEFKKKQENLMQLLKSCVIGEPPNIKDYEFIEDEVSVDKE